MTLLDNIDAVVDGRPMQQGYIFLVGLVHVNPSLHEFHTSVINTKLCGPHNIIAFEVLG